MQKKIIKIINYKFYNDQIPCFSQIGIENNLKNLIKTYVLCILSFIKIFKTAFN